jgi:hypothetical protein
VLAVGELFGFAVGFGVAVGAGFGVGDWLLVGVGPGDGVQMTIGGRQTCIAAEALSVATVTPMVANAKVPAPTPAIKRCQPVNPPDLMGPIIRSAV